MSLPIIYRWADGSFVELSAVGRTGKYATFWLVSVDGPLIQIGLGLDRSAFSYVFNSRYLEIERKISGFLLDLGVSPNEEGFLLGGMTPVAIPHFVSEDRWSKRFDLAKNTIRNENYMEKFSHFTTWYETVYSRWHSHWRIPHKTAQECTHEANVVTFEDAVDAVLSKNNILPESARADWEKENTERGLFLIPSPEEVEVFRILEEPLPFFLPNPQREEWFEARGAWSWEEK